MAGAGDHGVIAVGVALLRTTWMNVYIGHNGQATSLANVPQFAEMMTIKSNDSSFKRPRVKIIVEDEVNDVGAALTTIAEQEGPTLSTTAAATQS